MQMLSDYGYKRCVNCDELAHDGQGPLWEGDECDSCSAADSRYDMSLIVSCRTCREPQRIDVNADDWARWKGGEYVQVAMPYLDADQREMLISATCSFCWEKMFGDWE